MNPDNHPKLMLVLTYLLMPVLIVVLGFRLLKRRIHRAILNRGYKKLYGRPMHGMDIALFNMSHPLV